MERRSGFAVLALAALALPTVVGCHWAEPPSGGARPPELRDPAPPGLAATGTSTPLSGASLGPPSTAPGLLPTAAKAAAIPNAAEAAAQLARAQPSIGLPPPAKPHDPALQGLIFLHVTIQSSLEEAVVAQVGSLVGPALAQVAKRVMVWWVDVKHDLRKGDRVEIVYELPPGEEPLLDAIWFSSSKFGKTFSAVRYQAEGSRFARLYQDDGTDVELRLQGGPVDSYEQITSLLSDGRGHKGVDFKCPEGTPVSATFDGQIVRKNWSVRANGDCLDIEDVRTGDHAYFLHLSAIESGAAVGTKVRRGQLIAHSGNTGHSTAPHLHYQLVRGEKVLDPFKLHSTHREQLNPAELPKLKKQFEKYSKLRMGQI